MRYIVIPEYGQSNVPLYCSTTASLVTESSCWVSCLLWRTFLSFPHPFLFLSSVQLSGGWISYFTNHKRKNTPQYAGQQHDMRLRVFTSDASVVFDEQTRIITSFSFPASLFWQVSTSLFSQDSLGESKYWAFLQLNWFRDLIISSLRARFNPLRLKLHFFQIINDLSLLRDRAKRWCKNYVAVQFV